MLKKALSEDKNMIFTVLDATEIVQESMDRLSPFPPSAVHLGQGLMASLLLQSLTAEKDESKISMQWSVDGPFGNLYTEAKHPGYARGTIIQAQANVDNYETGLGHGTLQVRKNPIDAPDQVTTGIVKSKGNVNDDLLEYIDSSEQRLCSTNMSVKVSWKENREADVPFYVEYALAYMVEVLPQANEEKTNQILVSTDSFLESLGPISEWALPEDRLGSMLGLLSANQPYKETYFQKAMFQCNCSEERAERAAKLSEKFEDKSELVMQNESKTTETLEDDTLKVQCEFCGKVYFV